MGSIFSFQSFAEMPQTKFGEREIDFVKFAFDWCEKNKSMKGRKNYLCAVNSLCRFMGKSKIPISDITARSMRLYEESLKGYKRAYTLYTRAIVKLFNEAVAYYNDEDSGLFIIRHNLSKYKAPRQKVTKKRGLPIEVVRAIFSLPYDNFVCRGNPSRHDLAKDCFMLSFCLLGMNSADLFNARFFDGRVIIYQRTKTKDRRFDCAEMQVRVPSIVAPLIAKYKGVNHVFNFAERYSSMETFNRAINVGLKEVGREIGIEGLQFYAARHSMASIAVNRVGIDKYTVNDMLNHIDQGMRVTDIYIEKDFTRVNLANEKLMRFMFP